eukprot:TRINITY_DN311_c0_g4_i2.p1 TRINITY_DN311_c0_g4~~TRINITY_DN311_c0_g4_i2.p1  ORF type:complete len:152 (-),score=45.01 TRINITY_DN311_c0_g4_i2:36-491(-)
MIQNSLIHPRNRLINDHDIFSNKRTQQETIDRLSDPSRWMFLTSLTHLRRLKYGNIVNAFSPAIGGGLAMRAVTATALGLTIASGIGIMDGEGAEGMEALAGVFLTALVFSPYSVAMAHIFATPFVYPFGWYLAKLICMAQDGDVEEEPKE